MDCCIVGWKKRRLSKTGLSLYAELEIPKDANEREINLAFKRLALRFHPDKNPQGAEKFKEINRIHKILTDVRQKEIYDEYGSFGLYIAEKYGEEEVQFYALLSSAWFQVLTVVTGCFCCFCCCCCCNGCCGLCCKEKPEDDENSVIPTIDEIVHRSIEYGQTNSTPPAQSRPVIVIQPSSSQSQRF